MKWDYKLFFDRFFAALVATALPLLVAQDFDWKHWLTAVGIALAAGGGYDTAKFLGSVATTPKTDDGGQG